MGALVTTIYGIASPAPVLAYVHTLSTLCPQMIPLGGSFKCTSGCNCFVWSYMYPARIDHIWEADGLKRRVVWESSVLKLVSTISTSCQQDPLLKSTVVNATTASLFNSSYIVEFEKMRCRWKMPAWALTRWEYVSRLEL